MLFIFSTLSAAGALCAVLCCACLYFRCMCSYVFDATTVDLTFPKRYSHWMFTDLIIRPWFSIPIFIVERTICLVKCMAYLFLVKYRLCIRCNTQVNVAFTKWSSTGRPFEWSLAIIFTLFVYFSSARFQSVLYTFLLVGRI